MASKPTHKELEKGVQDLEKEIQVFKRENTALHNAINELTQEIEARSSDLKKAKKENEQMKVELEERIMMTDVLHENEQQFRALVTSIPGAVYRFRIDSDWTTEFVSDVIEEITAYPASKFRWNPVKTYRDIIHPDDKKEVERAITNGMDPMQSYDIEYRIYDANSRIRWIHETWQAVYGSEGEPLWLDGTIFDESKRKFAEEELQKANKELQRLASVDGLTQIANRRHFDTSLEKEWRRMIREKNILSLILCDIDFFKYYNDNYGHQEGDRCLQRVAQAIDSALKRPGDMVARYGGEEFVAILPNTDSKGAEVISERIREEILKLRIPHAHSGTAPHVTLSLGVSTALPNHGSRPETLIESADKALYEAKEQGRNRTVVHKNNYEGNLPQAGQEPTSLTQH